MARNSKVKAIFFDLGKVLLDFEFEIATMRLTGGDGQTAALLAEFIEDSETSRAFYTGKLTSDEFYEILQQGFHIEVGFRQFLDMFVQIFSENPVGLKLFWELKKRYPIGIISNIFEPHARYVERTFPSLWEKTHPVFSCDIGLMKPDAKIFEAALAAIGVGPEESVFMDDCQRHVEGAARVGIKALVFKPEWAEMKRQLQELGVIA